MAVKCQFCDRPAEWACTRPVEKYVRVTVARLRIGDLVCRVNEWAPKRGCHAEVIRIEEIVRVGLVEVEIAIHRETQTIRLRSFRALPSQEMRSARPAPCGVRICDVCAQDLGEPHRYCPEHWIKVEELTTA